MEAFTSWSNTRTTYTTQAYSEHFYLGEGGRVHLASGVIRQSRSVGEGRGQRHDQGQGGAWEGHYVLGSG